MEISALFPIDLDLLLRQSLNHLLEWLCPFRFFLHSPFFYLLALRNWRNLYHSEHGFWDDIKAGRPLIVGSGNGIFARWFLNLGEGDPFGHSDHERWGEKRNASSLTNEALTVPPVCVNQLWATRPISPGCETMGMRRQKAIICSSSSQRYHAGFFFFVFFFCFLRGLLRRKITVERER